MSSSRNSLRCGQLNMQGSAVVMAEFERIACEHDLDLIFMQEPYSVRGKLPGIRGKVLLVGEVPKAALWIRNDSITAMMVGGVSTTHHVCAQLLWKGRRCTSLLPTSNSRNPLRNT